MVSNIPYYITSPIINKLLEIKENISKDIYNGTKRGWRKIN